MTNPTRITIALDSETRHFVEEMKREARVSQSELVRRALRFYHENKAIADVSLRKKLDMYIDMLMTHEDNASASRGHCYNSGADGELELGLGPIPHGHGGSSPCYYRITLQQFNKESHLPCLLVVDRGLAVELIPY